MNYLKYIEHSAENLQFFLWLRAYAQKFNALPEAERGLSPEWTAAHVQTEPISTAARKMKVSADTNAVLQGTGLETQPKASENEKNPFHTPPTTPSEGSNAVSSEVSSNDGNSTEWSSNKVSSVDVHRKAAEVYDEAGLKWQPCKSRRFRRRPIPV